MTLHLLKLCVGISNVDMLKNHQRRRLEALEKAGKPIRLIHKTRQMPKRHAELSSGGSIYWVIKGAIQVRQALLALEEGVTIDGRTCCVLVLDPKLVLVQSTPRRAFQGWRYLNTHEAPPDLSKSQAQAIAQMPAEMHRELLKLALI